MEFPFGFEEFNKEFSKLSDNTEEEFTEEDFEELKAEGVPERPHFPFIIFIFAVFIDIVKTSTLGFFGIITALLGHLLVRIYLMGKMSFIKRLIYKKAIAAAVKNVIPVFGAFLGSWSWFILRAHSKNHEKIDQILTSFENLIKKLG